MLELRRFNKMVIAISKAVPTTDWTELEKIKLSELREFYDILNKDILKNPYLYKEDCMPRRVLEFTKIRIETLTQTIRILKGDIEVLNKKIASRAKRLAMAAGLNEVERVIEHSTKLCEYIEELKEAVKELERREA